MRSQRKARVGAGLGLLLLSGVALGAEAVVEARRGPPAPPLVRAGDGGAAWPLPDEPLPGVARVAEEARTVEEAAAALQALAPAGRARVKAVHDLVVHRLGYSAHQPGRSEDARTAYARRTGNCEGYARLFAELARLAGEQAAYVPGLALEPGATVPVSHAWNAVRLDGRWELVDATFDDPTLKRPGLPDGQGYRTDYLFVPPEVAILDHLPSEPRWQLLGTPLSRVDFSRPHQARVTSVRQGVALLMPAQAAVAAARPLRVRVDNAQQRYLLVTLGAATCGLDDGPVVEVECPAPAAGRHLLQVLTNTQETGLFLSVLSMELEAR